LPDLELSGAGVWMIMFMGSARTPQRTKASG
jgi:hypothetical protein